MADPTKRRRWSTGKKVALWLAVVGVLGGGAVGVVRLNEIEDRPRAMYHDTLLMAALQHDQLREAGGGVELTVTSSSPPVLIGGRSFQPQPGVEITVERREESYCVQGRNQYGDETGWHCVDGSGEGPELGALDD